MAKSSSGSAGGKGSGGAKGAGGAKGDKSSSGKSGGDSSRGGYTSFGDMFDGGGPGQAGRGFGGALGGVSNALGFSPAGSSGYTSFGDRFDGGGPGQSGSTFSGGRLSGMANAIGLSPFGSGSGRSNAPIGMTFGGGDDAPPVSLLPAAPVAAAPVVSAPVVSAPADAGPSNVLGNLSGNVAFAPAPQFTFEQYLAMLNPGPRTVPPAVSPVSPILTASAPQGIMSLPAAGLMG